MNQDATLGTIYDDLNDADYQDEALSPEFRQRLIGIIDRVLRVRRYTFMLAGAATEHRLKPRANETCQTCGEHWPCIKVRAAAAPILNYIADLAPSPAPDLPSSSSGLGAAR